MPQRPNPSPSISCVIPAYNEAASLQSTLETMLATLRPLFQRIEVMVVDDGHADISNWITRTFHFSLFILLTLIPCLQPDPRTPAGSTRL